jgi:hypothetical protein
MALNNVMDLDHNAIPSRIRYMLKPVLILYLHGMMEARNLKDQGHNTNLYRTQHMTILVLSFRQNACPLQKQ